MARREMELLLEVTRWDVPSRLGFKILNNLFPLEAMEYVYRLELEHILLVGLPLGILVQRHADINQ